MLEKLEGYLADKDIIKVREELIEILMINPEVSDGVFKKALQKSYNELGEALYEEENNAFEKKQNKKEWTSHYLSEIIIKLKSEFSKNLVDHAIEVADVVYPNRNQGRDLDQKQPIQVKSKKGGFVIIGIGLIMIFLIMLMIFILN